MLDLHNVDIPTKRKTKKFFEKYDGFNSESSDDEDTILMKRRRPEFFNDSDEEMKPEDDDNDENMWVTITTCNKMGRKPTINRCLLFPLSPLQHECDKFLVLGCHFGRSEAPFVYDATKNKYVEFQKQELSIDMYRSNDVVQFDSNYIYVRPFVKVGEPSESVKVFKYFVEKSSKEQKMIQPQELACNGPDKKQSTLELSQGVNSKRSSGLLTN